MKSIDANRKDMVLLAAFRDFDHSLTHLLFRFLLISVTNVSDLSSFLSEAYHCFVACDACIRSDNVTYTSNERKNAKAHFVMCVLFLVLTSSIACLIFFLSLFAVRSFSLFLSNVTQTVLLFNHIRCLIFLLRLLRFLTF